MIRTKQQYKALVPPMPIFPNEDFLPFCQFYRTFPFPNPKVLLVGWHRVSVQEQGRSGAGFGGCAQQGGGRRFRRLRCCCCFHGLGHRGFVRLGLAVGYLVGGW